MVKAHMHTQEIANRKEGLGPVKWKGNERMRGKLFNIKMKHLHFTEVFIITENTRKTCRVFMYNNIKCLKS